MHIAYQSRLIGRWRKVLLNKCLKGKHLGSDLERVDKCLLRAVFRPGAGRGHQEVGLHAISTQ